MRFQFVTVLVFMCFNFCFCSIKAGWVDAKSAFITKSISGELQNKRPEEKKMTAAHYLTVAKKMWKSNQYNAAIKNAKLSEKIASENHNAIEEADAIRILGLIYYEIGYFEKSNDNAFRALKIYEKQKNSKGQIQSLNNIANAFADQKNVSKATYFYNKSLFLSKNAGDSVSIATALHNIGYLNLEQKNYSIAQKYFEESLKINSRLRDEIKIGMSCSTLGEVFLSLGDYTMALNYYMKAKSIFEKSDSQMQLATTYLNLSHYYEETGDPEKSRAYAQKVFDLGKKLNLLPVQIPAAERLYKIDKKANAENADHSGLLYYKLRDSLESGQDLTKIAQLEMVYQLEKAEQQAVIKKQSKKYIFIIGAVICILCVVIFIFLMYIYIEKRRKKTVKEKEVLEEDLELKNKELTLNVMSMMKSKTLSQDLISKLLEIKNLVTSDQALQSLDCIIRDLKKDHEKDIWKDFELRFKEVHTSFYNELSQRFPNLSPNEIKTAAFIRLNLSSKDIAELTGKRVETIEISRYRLRKKLGITNQQTNLTTFLSQLNHNPKAL